MDNKKKYNKALERARVYCDNARAVGDYAAVARYENIFPELRENEDEKIRKEIINFLETIPISELKRVPRPICQWFFWLEKQKEQKSAWSEENEKIMDTIVSVLGQYIDYKAVSGTGSGYATPRYSKEIDWLKSLRPSWKPSEEQIDALKELIDDANRAGWVTPGATELYEQLKKL